MAFQLQRFSFKSLQKLNISDRIKAVRDREIGQELAYMLSPTQAAMLFPAYYRREMPDIGGFIRSLPSGVSAAKQRQYEQQIQNTTSGAAAGANMKAGGWLKHYQENMDSERAQVSRKGTVPLPQLSPEQRQNFEALKSSPLTTDDPRMKFLAGIDDSKLQSVGITKYKQDGKEYYQYSAPSPSDEDVKKFAASGSRGGNSFFNAIIRAEGTDKHGDPYETSLGYMKSPKPLTEMTMAESLAWGDQIRTAQGLNSSAKGAFQIVNTTQRAAMKALGIGMDEKFSPENQRRMAAWIAQQQGLGAWEGLKIHRDQWQIAQEAMGQGLHRQYAESISDFSKINVEAKRRELQTLEETKRLGSLAQFTQPMTGGDISGVPLSRTTTGHKGDGVQCVDLSKHYAPGIGQASSWTFHKGQDGMVPGAVIATTNYGNGEGGRTAAQMGGVSHYHTGVLLTKPDASGYALIYDQAAGHGARITRVNVNNYNGTGTPMAVVNGGESSDQTRRAIADATAQASDAEKQAISASVAGVQPPPVTALPTPESGRIQETETPKGNVNQEGKVLSKQEVEQSKALATAAVEKPAAAKVTSERYKVDTAKFVEAIRQTEEFKSQAGMFGGMVPDSTIINGFNDDPRVKAAGVRLDEKGVMHFDKGQNDQTKEVMAGMNAKSFMTKIEEKKKEEAKKPEVKSVEQKAPTAPTPTAPQVPAPDAATQVKPKAEGGKTKVNTGEIAAYPIGGLRGDNAVVVNAQKQPLFTMNTNEAAVMNPDTKTVDVIPNQKDGRVGPASQQQDQGMVQNMVSEFQSAINDLRKSFTENKSVAPGTREVRQTDVDPQWIDKLTHSMTPYSNPAAQRAIYRANGQETGDPTNGFHHSRGNVS